MGASLFVGWGRQDAGDEGNGTTGKGGAKILDFPEGGGAKILNLPRREAVQKNLDLINSFQ